MSVQRATNPRLPPDEPPETQFTAVQYRAELPLPAVSLRRCLTDRRRDSATGLPLGPASAALRYLLPIYDLERNVPPDTSRLQAKLDASPLLLGVFASHVTGSSVERLSVPPYTQRTESQLPEYAVADVDVMQELKQLPVSLRQGAGPLYMDTTRASHRGYTRVVVEPAVAEANPIFCKAVEEDGQSKLYLSIDWIADWIEAKSKKEQPEVFVHRQGPAVNMKQTKEGTRGGHFTYKVDHDVVLALPLTERPAEVSQWLERVQDRLWPSAQLREEIQQSGRCFLVGAGHSSSQRRDLEWRLSFSDLEKRLALSISPQQRKVYVLIKMLQKCYLQEPKVVVTYHIKTLMFWELEESNDTQWLEEELFEHVLAMLDRIQTCLEQHYIPSYFIPDNNLISHVSDADVAQSLATVRQIRLRPLQHLFGIEDLVRFDFSSLKPLSQLHAPLHSALLSGADASGVAEALAISLIEQAQADVRRGMAALPRCVRLLRDAWQALAAVGDTDGPHPVHDEWRLFAAAATFISMGADESVWAMLALQMSEPEERTETARPVSEETAVATSGVAPRLAVGQDGAEDDGNPVADQLARSGGTEVPFTVSMVLAFRYAQLELMRDLKHKQLENITGFPPSVSAIVSARFSLGLIDRAFQHQLKCGVAREVALAQVVQKCAAMSQGLQADSAGAKSPLPSRLRSEVAEVMAGHSASLGLPGAARGALDHLTSITDKLGAVAQSSSQNPTQLPFDSDPGALAVIPQYMIDLYLKTLGSGLSQQELDQFYTPFFNMMGFFLKHKMYKYAFRTTGLMTCLKLTLSEPEQQKVVYNINSTPLYVQQLPDPVQALLRLTTGRTTIGVLYCFIELLHWTFDAEQVRGLLTTSSPEQELEKFEAAILEAAPFVSPEVQLTHLVMRLIALKILGRDTEVSLPDVVDAGGEGVAQEARDILSRWRPAIRAAAPDTDADRAARRAALDGTPAAAVRETESAANEAPGDLGGSPPSNATPHNVTHGRGKRKQTGRQCVLV